MWQCGGGTAGAVAWCTPAVLPQQSLAFLGDGLGERVLAAPLGTAGQEQRWQHLPHGTLAAARPVPQAARLLQMQSDGAQVRSLPRGASEQLEVRHPGLPLGDGAGLVQDHGLHVVSRLQGVAALDQHAVRGAHAGAHHDGRGSRQAQRAGAGHHQHRDGRHEAEREGALPARGGQLLWPHNAAAREQQPRDQCQQAQAHHHRNEKARDAVRKLLHGGALRLSLLHEAHDLGEGRLLPDGMEPHAEHAAAVHCASDHLVARALGDGHRLPRERRLVHGRLA
mmetsp:Transcript_105379/g.297783  ORF Transcript_105379/g.297783 Transcript_105379/m.297783 type:complete len:281 (-) Transcript_105379:738-1580(-)